jgi:hypothetical protein
MHVYSSECTYKLCTDAFTRFQKSIDMDIHVYQFLEIYVYVHVYDVYVL